jgi:hypothetical protein
MWKKVYERFFYRVRDMNARGLLFTQEFLFFIVYRSLVPLKVKYFLTKSQAYHASPFEGRVDQFCFFDQKNAKCKIFNCEKNQFMHFKFCLFRFFDLKIFADYQQSIELIDPAPLKGAGG